MRDPERVRHHQGLTPSVSGIDLIIEPWASRKAARSRLFNYILSGWKLFGCGSVGQLVSSES
jgi:hypothetical protein